MKPYIEELIQETKSPTTPVSAVEGELRKKLENADGLDLLKELLAMLRAMSWQLQTLHWQVKGKDFYELHLLFERLYDALGDQIDVLAEKVVGYYGVEVVDGEDSIELATRWLKGWKGDPVESAIKAEKQLQSLLKHTYTTMSEKEELSLGLDDYLMSLASDHETHLYLLGQLKR